MNISPSWGPAGNEYSAPTQTQRNNPTGIDPSGNPETSGAFGGLPTLAQRSPEERADARKKYYSETRFYQYEHYRSAAHARQHHVHREMRPLKHFRHPTEQRLAANAFFPHQRFGYIFHSPILIYRLIKTEPHRLPSSCGFVGTEGIERSHVREESIICGPQYERKNRHFG